MSSFFHNPVSDFFSGVDCGATLERLVGNLSGFAYRRRHDARWTMEFTSAGWRDITGYDPHRFIANQSLAWADLIAPGDWKRVNDAVRAAVQDRRRATVGYLIRAAHGIGVPVEDRFAPVFDGAGQVVAIEGVIDHARNPGWRGRTSLAGYHGNAQPASKLTVRSQNSSS